MKSFSPAIFFNVAVFFTAVTAIVFFSVRFYLPLSLSIFFSTFLSLLLSLLYLKSQIKKRNKQLRQKSENSDRERVFTNLCLMPDKQLIQLLVKALKKEGKEAEQRKKSIITDDNLVIFPYFSFNGLTKDDIAKFYNSLSKNERGVIICQSCSVENKNFILRFGEKLKLEDKDKVYELLKRTELLPDNATLLPEDKKKRKISLKNFFERKKAKKFLAFGSYFLIASFFMRYKIYYLVFGMIFISFFLIALFFGKKEAEDQNSIW